MYFADVLMLDAPRRTADGYMAVRARAARVGIYQYSGAEVDPDNKHGLRDQASVNVLRDENTVFDKKSAHSFVGKPITDDHPAESVNASNWRDHARGVVMGALRDGDHLAFDLLLTDGATIAKVDAGKVELSNGYGASLSFGDFTAPDGTKCQARQDSVTGNHVAIVDRGRAGSSCRIGDAKVCDALPSNILDTLKTEKPVKTILIDGLTVDMSNADTAIATVQTLIAARDAATAQVKATTDKVATLTAESQTKDAKIATLEQQVKDAKPTPAQLRDAGKALMVVADKAKALGVKVTDEMDGAAIMKAAVNAKMGDAAKDWTDEQIAASFAVLTKDAGVQRHTAPNGTPQAVVTDSRAFYQDAQAKRRAELSGAWNTPAKTAAA